MAYGKLVAEAISMLHENFGVPAPEHFAEGNIVVEVYVVFFYKIGFHPTVQLYPFSCFKRTTRFPRIIKIITRRTIANKYTGPPEIFHLDIGIDISCKSLKPAVYFLVGYVFVQHAMIGIVIDLDTVVPTRRLQPAIGSPECMIDEIIIEKNTHVIDIILLIGQGLV